MATKKVKGQKLNLAEFVGPLSAHDMLPSGPSGLPEEERPRGGRFGQGGSERGGFERGERGDRNDRNDRNDRGDREEEGPSRADEADRWRSRAAAPASRPERSYGNDRPSYDRPERSFDRSERSERSFGDRAERSGGFDRDGPVRRTADESERAAPRSDDAADWRGARAAPSGDQDAEWRRHRSAGRDRDGESSESGERRGFGFRGGDRSAEPRSDRYEARGGDRYEPRGDRSSDRFGADRSSDRFGGDREPRSDRFGGDRESRGDRFGSSDRFGGDREPRSDRFGGERSERPERSFGGDRSERTSYGARREREEPVASERPAHLLLLKKGAEIDPSQPIESSTERMERLALEREQRLKPTEPASRASISDDLKQPELAPIKLSTTRRAPPASETRLEPARTTSTSVLRKKESPAAPAPAPVPIVMDESRYDSNVLKSVVAAGSKKQNPIELALEDKQTTIKDGDLDALKTMDFTTQSTDIAGVLARSIGAKTLHLSSFASSITALNTDDARNLFALTLSSINQRKGESELLSLIDASSVNVLSILVPSNDAADIDRVLTQHSLMFLKPVRDLSVDIKAKLPSINQPSELVSYIDTELGSKSSNVSPAVAKLVATHVFELVFVNAKTPDYSVISTWSSGLKRVSTDQPTKLVVCFAAQSVWNKSTTAPKGAFKDTFIALEKAGIMSTDDFAAWRDDLKDKTPGKPKALLQVGAWIKLAEEEQKKRAPKHAKQQESESEHEEDDEEDEEQDEDEEEYDPAYPKRR